MASLPASIKRGPALNAEQAQKTVMGIYRRKWRAPLTVAISKYAAEKSHLKTLEDDIKAKAYGWEPGVRQRDEKDISKKHESNDAFLASALERALLEAFVLGHDSMTSLPAPPKKKETEEEKKARERYSLPQIPLKKKQDPEVAKLLDSLAFKYGKLSSFNKDKNGNLSSLTKDRDGNFVPPNAGFLPSTKPMHVQVASQIKDLITEHERAAEDKALDFLPEPAGRVTDLNKGKAKLPAEIAGKHLADIYWQAFLAGATFEKKPKR